MVHCSNTYCRSQCQQLTGTAFLFDSRPHWFVAKSLFRNLEYKRDVFVRSNCEAGVVMYNSTIRKKRSWSTKDANTLSHSFSIVKMMTKLFRMSKSRHSDFDSSVRQPTKLVIGFSIVTGVVRYYSHNKHGNQYATKSATDTADSPSLEYQVSY